MFPTWSTIPNLLQGASSLNVKQTNAPAPHLPFGFQSIDAFLSILYSYLSPSYSSSSTNVILGCLLQASNRTMKSMTGHHLRPRPQPPAPTTTFGNASPRRPSSDHLPSLPFLPCCLVQNRSTRTAAIRAYTSFSKPVDFSTILREICGIQTARSRYLSLDRFPLN